MDGSPTYVHQFGGIIEEPTVPRDNATHSRQSTVSPL
jgi:hypothetical protein